MKIIEVQSDKRMEASVLRRNAAENRMICRSESTPAKKKEN